MTTVKFKHGTKDKLDEKSIENGAIYVTTDTEELAVDIDGKRVTIGEEPDIVSEDAAGLLPTLTGKSNEFFNGQGQWVEINNEEKNLFLNSYDNISNYFEPSDKNNPDKVLTGYWLINNLYGSWEGKVLKGTDLPDPKFKEYIQLKNTTAYPNTSRVILYQYIKDLEVDKYYTFSCYYRTNNEIPYNDAHIYINGDRGQSKEIFVTNTENKWSFIKVTIPAMYEQYPNKNGFQFKLELPSEHQGDLIDVCGMTLVEENVVTKDYAGTLLPMPAEDNKVFYSDGTWKEIENIGGVQELNSGDLLAQQPGIYRLNGSWTSYTNVPGVNRTTPMTAYLFMPNLKDGAILTGLFSRKSTEGPEQSVWMYSSSTGWKNITPDMTDLNNLLATFSKTTTEDYPVESNNTSNRNSTKLRFRVNKEFIHSLGREYEDILVDPETIVYGTSTNKYDSQNYAMGLVPMLKIDGTEGSKYLAGDGTWKELDIPDIDTSNLATLDDLSGVKKTVSDEISNTASDIREEFETAIAEVPRYEIVSDEKDGLVPKYTEFYSDGVQVGYLGWYARWEKLSLNNLTFNSDRDIGYQGIIVSSYRKKDSVGMMDIPNSPRWMDAEDFVFEYTNKWAGKKLGELAYKNESYITEKLSAVYTPKGSVKYANLPNPSKDAIGYVYNIEDAFTTDNRFLEGEFYEYPAGTNVVCIEAGTNTYKYDVLAGTINLSNYVTVPTLGDYSTTTQMNTAINTAVKKLATTTSPGAMPTLSNDENQFLNGKGAWADFNTSVIRYLANVTGQPAGEQPLFFVNPARSGANFQWSNFPSLFNGYNTSGNVLTVNNGIASWTKISASSISGMDNYVTQSDLSEAIQVATDAEIDALFESEINSIL